MVGIKMLERRTSSRAGQGRGEEVEKKTGEEAEDIKEEENTPIYRETPWWPREVHADEEASL